MTENRAMGDKRQKLNLKFKDLPEKKNRIIIKIEK